MRVIHFISVQISLSIYTELSCVNTNFIIVVIISSKSDLPIITPSVCTFFIWYHYYFGCEAVLDLYNCKKVVSYILCVDFEMLDIFYKWWRNQCPNWELRPNIRWFDLCSLKRLPFLEWKEYVQSELFLCFMLRFSFCWKIFVKSCFIYWLITPYLWCCSWIRWNSYFTFSN